MYLLTKNTMLLFSLTKYMTLIAKSHHEVDSRIYSMAK